MGGPSALTKLSLTLTAISMAAISVNGDNNHVYSPCRDTTVQRHDGFTFALAFSSKSSFYLNNNASLRLSPCDRRLSLSSSSSNSQIALFRPKVDEISLITVNTSSFSPESAGGYMVAFAGSKYAARSNPVFVANDTYIVSSFTLVLEFNKGRLQNLYWKTDKCASCQGKSKLVCVNRQYCAMRQVDCKRKGGSVDCSLGIQVAFSGTDKHYSVLNSWYEVAKLRQYSLYGLYSNLRKSLTDQYDKLF